MYIFYFKDLPEIARYPSTSPIIEGGNTTLVCQASGNPQPNITWTKRWSNKTLSYSDGLFLSNVTRFDDKTEYECKAMNYLGFVEASVSVTIHCKWMWYRFLLLYKNSMYSDFFCLIAVNSWYLFTCTLLFVKKRNGCLVVFVLAKAFIFFS